ncbi:MAG TPA: bacterial Ig-like domain-containing protein [Mobilitalea sp.]|nr:bacterial Ig-like domain-containing protein [Mobilitalea sp.]
MKNKIIKIIFLSFLITGLSNIYINTAKAEDTTGQTTDGSSGTSTDGTVEVPEEGITPAPEEGTTQVPEVTQIAITQLPSKTNYAKGEELDLSDMVVAGYYPDGTSAVITDYQVIGYHSDQIGTQTVMIYYQNQIAYFNVSVMPAKVTNITATYHDTANLMLTWDAVPSAARYEVYQLDDATGTYNLVSYVYTNSISFTYTPGTVHSYQICTVENSLGIEYRGAMSDPFTAATNPDTVVNLVVTSIGTRSISLSWDAVPGATGYLVYRATASTENYVLCGTTNATALISNRLISGKSYNYKVCAYTYDGEYSGGFSNVVDISTNPSNVALKYKAGDQKVRFTWGKVNGATAYDIYVGNNVNGFTLLNTVAASGRTYTYIAEGLTTGSTYTFYAVARRDYNGVSYLSPSPNMLNIEIKAVEPTSSTGKLFDTKEAFLNSWTYKTISFFNAKVNYDKSYAIPGLITTNVGGFSCNTMCPQGTTFAGNYLLVSAYDMSGAENSVIYVMDKETKELLTTLVLPSKPHAGGLAFDGVNVWVTNGSKVSSILYTDIDAAAQSMAPYAYVNYATVCPLGIITSYVTYYDNRLWVGTYNELQSTILYSYVIENKDASPSLTPSDTMVMPTRVQGLAFTNQGTLILSRSCQLYKGLRGYMRQLDVYKPDYTNAVGGVIQLGNLVNSVSMPSMNEDIAIDGSYLYVNYESAAFDTSTYKMDRVCAFKLVDVVKKPKQK